MQQSNSIQNSKKMQTELKTEIYNKSFYHHPFHIECGNLHSYSVIKFILELIHNENGIKAFDTHLYPDDIHIEEYPNGVPYYGITIPNDKFDETKEESYTNSRMIKYEVLMESEQKIEERLEETIAENICATCPTFLLGCIKPNTFKEVNEIEGEEPEQRPPPETVYHNDECPVCLGEYDDEVVKKVASCGHCLCNDCWVGILTRDNSKCPQCRMEWDEENGVAHIETIPYELEDIIELCQDGNTEVLFEILDMRQVVDTFLLLQEANTLLGFDYEGDLIEGELLPEEYSSMFELPDYRIFIRKA